MEGRRFVYLLAVEEPEIEDDVYPEPEPAPEDGEPVNEEDDERGRSFGAALRGQQRATLIEAYRLYQECPQQHEHALYRAVLDFVTQKLYHLEIDFRGRGTVHTVDDFAQRVALKVWRGLPKKTGRTPENFYNWVCLLCQKQSKSATRALRKELSRKVPLTLTIENGTEYDNPAVYESRGIDRTFMIPEWVQGTDRDICELIQDGKTYAQIGQLLGMKEDAVKQRMSRLRAKAKKTKEEK
jgi:RNA polymerase sigma factor (sigma-70 family)